MLFFCAPRCALAEVGPSLLAKSPKTTTLKRNSANFVGVSFSSNVRQMPNMQSHSLAKALFCIEFPFFPKIFRLFLGNRLKASSRVNSLPLNVFLLEEKSMLPQSLQKLAGFSRQCAARTSFTTQVNPQTRHTWQWALIMAKSRKTVDNHCLGSFSDIQRPPATSSDVLGQQRQRRPSFARSYHLHYLLQHHHLATRDTDTLSKQCLASLASSLVMLQHKLSKPTRQC